MATGYSNDVVNETRTRLDALLAGITQHELILTRARDAEQYKMDSEDFYLAARHKLMALRTDLDYFIKFIEANHAALDSYEYYQIEIQGLSDYLEALESTSIQSAGVSAQEKAEESIVGIVEKVVDGDGIYIGEREIRMAGIDAPELGTSAGKVSQKFLEDLVLGKEVTVLIDPHTPREVYGRVLGVVMLGDLNVNVHMLANCMAIPLLKFGKHKYIDPDENRQVHEKCVMGWPPTGMCKITTDPTHAAIHVDGKDIGEITPSEVRLPVGIHTITFIKAGCTSVRDEIIVEKTKREYPVWKLPKLPANTGIVEVRSVQDDGKAIVLMDGLVYGVAPVVIELPVDKSTVISINVDGKEVSNQSIMAVLGRVIKVTL